MSKVFLLFVLIGFFFRPAVVQADPCYETFRTLPEFSFYSPWLCDPVFLEIDQKYPDPFPPEWRWKPVRYFQYVLSRNALAVLEGDFIECGLFSGKSMDIFSSVLDRWDTKGRMVYGFDSFEGTTEPEEADLDLLTGMQYFSFSGNGPNKEDIARALSYHKCQIELVKGWIPQCFQGYEDKRFCFAHIDVDLYQATYDALAFVYPRTLAGGIILFDDYGYSNCPGAKKAVDEYLADKPEILISIPTGQAFLIKQRSVGN